MLACTIYLPIVRKAFHAHVCHINYDMHVKPDISWNKEPDISYTRSLHTAL